MNAPPTVSLFASGITGSELPDFEAEMIAAGLRRVTSTLQYGGTTEGLMCQVARAFRKAGGSTVGIIPADVQVLVDIAEPSTDGHTSLLVGSMDERRNRLVSRLTLAVVLPGGIGTIDELSSALVHQQFANGPGRFPIVVYSRDGFFAPLELQLHTALEAGFLHSSAIQSLFFERQLASFLERVSRFDQRHEHD